MISVAPIALVVVAVVTLAGCSGAATVNSEPTTPSSESLPTPTAIASPSATPGPDAATLTVTLTDTECRADGGLLLQPGLLVVTAVNRDTASSGSFQLLRIGDIGTYDDLAAHVAAEQARIDAGEELAHIPDYASEVDGVFLEAGADESFEATVEQGTYAIVCADWADETSQTGSDPERGGRILIIGPLIVGDGDAAASSHCSYRAEYQLAYEVPGMDEVEITCDTVYKEIAGVPATLDLYLPPDTAEGERLPTVIYVHGNEASETLPLEEHWKRYGYRVGTVLAAMEYTVIAFDYRGYSGSQRLAEAYDDVLDLLTHVDANASELHADTDRMCLFGVSGAGMPATWAAIHGDPRPDCVVLLSAGIRPVNSPEIDPLEFVSADMPPFFIGYGALDAYANPDRFLEATSAVGAEVIAEEHPGRHGFENQADPDQQRIVEAALAFLAEHIGAQ